MNKRGTNQYRVKNKYPFGLSADTVISVLSVALVTAVTLPLLKSPVLSPCPADGCFVKTVYAKEEQTELQQIVNEIVKTFEPEGKHVVVQAINCFYSESGLRSNAVNVNNNGSNDVGVAQINSIHGMSTEDRLDATKNIKKAYQIYKNRGWKAWYGAKCQ